LPKIRCLSKFLRCEKIDYILLPVVVVREPEMVSAGGKGEGDLREILSLLPHIVIFTVSLGEMGEGGGS